MDENKKNKLKERLTNELGDKLRSIEMDVTNSFLSGKICSPLIATADNAVVQANAIASGTLNGAAVAGLYITKDGLRYDPTVMTDAAGLIVNSAIQSVTSEIVRIKDNAVRDITYIPDPSIILKKAISYFAYDIKNDVIDINKLLEDLNVNVDDKETERQDEAINKTHKSLNNFISYTIPELSNKLTTISNNINTVTGYAASYMAFGPEWVTEKVSYYIADGSYIAETFVNEQTKKLNDWKIEQYNRLAKTIGTQMTKKYQELIKQNVKAINNETAVVKEKLKLKGTALMQKASLEIMAKTGIKIPINKVKPENLSKLKRTTELSKLLGLAAQALPLNGPSTLNDNEITNAEVKEDIQYSQLLQKRRNQLNQLKDGKSIEISNLEYSIETEIYLDEIDYLESEIEICERTINSVDFYINEIDEYLLEGSSVFEKYEKENIEIERNLLSSMRHSTSIDELINNIMYLLTNNSWKPRKGKTMAWDDTIDDYTEFDNKNELDVIGKKKNEYVPEMYAQNFMNAGGNGPIEL